MELVEQVSTKTSDTTRKWPVRLSRVHDMRRVTTSYNSPHIATNVYELYQKSFGEN